MNMTIQCSCCKKMVHPLDAYRRESAVFCDGCYAKMVTGVEEEAERIRIKEPIEDWGNFVDWAVRSATGRGYLH